MADDNLQYTVTFKTRAEGDGAQRTVQAVRDLAAEAERIDRLKMADKIGVQAAAYHDLSESVGASEKAIKAEYRAAVVSDEQKARAMQTVRQLREEEAKRQAHLKSLEVANATAAGGYKNLGGAAAMAAFQVQDAAVQLQAGVNMSTVIAQQLPQLLMIFGPGGAIAGGVIALGALAYKMATATEGTKEAAAAAAKYKEELDKLIGSEADAFVEAFALSLDHATRMQNDLNAAQIEGLDTAAQVSNAHRQMQASQDALTEAALRYMAAIHGVDVSVQLQKLKERDFQRNAEAAIEAQNVKLEKQRATYNEITRQIEEMKSNAADAEAKLQELNVKAAGLSKSASIAQGAGQDDRHLELQRELQKVTELRDYYDGLVKEAPAKIAELTEQAMQEAYKLDAVLATSAANIEAINADLASKTSAADLQAAVEQSKGTAQTLQQALAGFQAQTPAQAEAAAALLAAVEDGVLTAEEARRSAGLIQQLLGSLTTTQQSSNSVLLKILAALEKLARDQQAAEKRIDGIHALINGG